MKGILNLPLWKKNTIVSLFFVTVFYNGCSDVKFEADREAILNTLSSTAAVFINENDKYTNNQEVTLSIFANSADEMMITQNPNIETKWETYSLTKSWNLPNANSQSNVYVKFRSRGIETKDFVTDAIIHDNIAPVVTNDSAPSTWTNKTIADIGFSGKDNLSGLSKFYCAASLEDKFNLCKNKSGSKVNVYLGGLKEGAQYYYVKASDQAGNLSVATRARWNIDLTPPTVQFTGSLPTLINKSGTAFHFVGNDNQSGIDSYKCRVNGAGWTNCNSPYVTTAGNDGKYSLQIQAKDKAGNISAAQQHNWEVHLAAPIITFKNPLPATLSRQTNTQIGFQGSDKSFAMTEFQCQLNNTGFKNCSSPTNLSGLKHGNQIFTVRGKDRFGDWSRNFDYKFEVDIRTNRPQWGQVPGLFSKDPVALFDIITNEGDIVKYHCRLDNGAWQLCPGGQSPRYSGVGEGAHSLQARVEDRVGNLSDSIYYNWVHDKTAPNINLSGPQGRSKDTNSKFHIQVSDNITKKEDIKILCNFNNQGFKDCNEYTTYSDLKEKEYTLVIKAIDQAKNETTAPERKWFIDNSSAQIIVKERPEAVLFEGENANILFDVNNEGYPVSSIKCKLNGYELGCTPNAPISIDGLKPKQYTYSIEVIDDIGFFTKKDIHFEVKAVGDCNLSDENVCLVLRDNFERDDLFNHSFAWEAFYHDTGDRVNGLEIAIHNDAPTTDGEKFLNFTGRAGASVHSLYLMTKPFNLSKYNRITIEFDYLLANLEDWKWAGKSGHEFLKLDVCTDGSYECGISDNVSDARNKLNDTNLWKNVFTDIAEPNRNKHLNGVNHNSDEFVRVTGNKVSINLRDLGTNDYSQIMIRINALMDEGLVSQTNDPDAVLVDNIKIKAYK